MYIVCAKVGAAHNRMYRVAASSSARGIHRWLASDPVSSQQAQSTTKTVNM